MVKGLHLYSAFIQSAVQFMPLIHPFTHALTHQRRLAAMQGTNQLVGSNLGSGVSLRDTSRERDREKERERERERERAHLLLLPPASAQLAVQPVGSRAPLRRQPADAPLHEAQGLLTRPHLLQEGADVRAEGRLGSRKQCFTGNKSAKMCAVCHITLYTAQ